MKPKTIVLSSSIGTIPLRLYYQNLAVELSRKGHKVIFLANNLKKLSVFPHEDVIVIGWPNERPVHWSDFQFFNKILNEYKPDCVIGNMAAGNVMVIASWLKKIPVRVIWYHTQADAAKINKDVGLSLKLRFLQARKKFVYRLANCIFTNTDNSKSEFKKNFLPDKPIEVFRFGVPDPLNIIQGGLKKEREQRFMFVGRILPSKGIDTLLRAIVLIKELDFTVTISGQGDIAEYQKMAQDLGIAAKCNFTGSLPWTEVVSGMSTALALVFPTRSEAFGFVSVESMSVGTPVIACRVGGVPEIVRDGSDGFLLNVDDAHAFAEKMKLLFENRELREKMSVNARAHFLEEFENTHSINSLANHAARIEKIME